MIEKSHTDTDAQPAPGPGDQAREGAIAQTFLDEDYQGLDSYGLARVMLAHWDVRWKAAQPPAAPVQTDEYAGAHEIYCNASRKLPVGCEACSCRAGREIKKLRALQCSSAGNVDACRAHVAETALREVRRYCETVDLSRSETLIALVKRTVDAALALSSDLPQGARK